MEYITIGIVLLPLLMSFIPLFLNRNKGSRVIIQILAFIFFLSALYIFLYPLDLPTVPIPSVIWKLLTLSIVIAFLIRSVLDKRYGVSIFLFIQSVILIITEITVSLNEPTPFLFFDHSEKLILLFGAFIIAASIPVLFRYTTNHTTNKKQTAVGALMLMSAFSGLVATESLTGLFLFWQLCFGANSLLIKACGNYEDIKYRRISLIQQIALTIWLSVNAAIYFSTGLTKISDVNMAAGNTAGLLCAISLITAMILGFLVPERNILKVLLEKPVSYIGLSAVVLSLLSQFVVLQKFGPLFTGLSHNLISLIILSGAFLMAAAAYYALSAKKAAEIPACMVLYVFGWGLAAAFTGKEGLFFTTGYTAVSALTIALMFCLIIANDYAERDKEANQFNFFGNTPLISSLMITVMVLFIFAPFYTGLNRILFVGFLTDYPVSMLIVIASFAVFTTAAFKWIIAILTAGKREKNENISLPVSLKIITFILFLASIGANILSGSIYKYFLYERSLLSYLPAKDLEEYAQLEGGIYLSGFGTGFIYLALTITLLTVLFVVLKKFAKNRAKEESTLFSSCRYIPTSLLPATINFEAFFKTGFIVIALLIAGVSLSCLI